MIHITNYEILLILVLILVIVLAAVLVSRQKMAVYKKQKQELQMYQLYVKPLNDFISEIRARQHEFDNHLNALLNMHLTIKDYDELVAAQSDYIRNLVKRSSHAYIGLLKISNKVLAGFLYSKLNSVPDTIHIDFMVGSKEIFTNVPEMDLVEVLGILIDNAVQACDDTHKEIKIYLTSEDDKFIFLIKNQYEKVPITVLSRFFERGYTTKTDQKNHGLGLYQAKKIIQQWNGDIYVENEKIDSKNYLSFHIIL